MCSFVTTASDFAARVELPRTASRPFVPILLDGPLFARLTPKVRWQT